MPAAPLARASRGLLRDTCAWGGSRHRALEPTHAPCAYTCALEHVCRGACAAANAESMACPAADDVQVEGGGGPLFAVCSFSVLGQPWALVSAGGRAVQGTGELA